MKKLQLKKEVVDKLTAARTTAICGGAKVKTDIGCYPLPITNDAVTCTCITNTCQTCYPCKAE